MAIGYYGVKLSSNWIETPEGYLVFKNAVIARTGFQIYKGSELPEDELKAISLEVHPNDNVDLYRDSEEVFSKKTIDSFQGKSITDGHPDNLLDIDTVEEHELGQVLNVRKGDEALPNGDWPLLADLIVKSKSLIEKIKAGLRELSCGYNYHLAKTGDVVCMVDIVGNHVAVVESGRAGKHAKIQDSAPIKEMEIFSMSKLNKIIRGLGFQKWAADAKPEDIATALDEMSAVDEKEHAKGCDCKDCKPGKDEKMEATDAKGNDRKKFHDALDRMLDSKDDEQNAMDEDMESLKSLFKGTAAEDEEKDADEEEKTEASDEDEDEESEAEDSDIDHTEGKVIAPEDRPEKDTPRATDSAAYRAGMSTALKALKPFVAKSKDARLKGAFDTATKLAKTATVKSNASYAKFARASATAKDSVNQKSYEDMANEAYAKARVERRGSK